MRGAGGMVCGVLVGVALVEEALPLVAVQPIRGWQRCVPLDLTCRAAQSPPSPIPITSSPLTSPSSPWPPPLPDPPPLPPRASSQVPQCYLHPPPRLQPPYFAKFQPDTLFYIFYGMPGDEAQLLAADELAARCAGGGRAGGWAWGWVRGWVWAQGGGAVSCCLSIGCLCVVWYGIRALCCGPRLDVVVLPPYRRTALQGVVLPQGVQGLAHPGAQHRAGAEDGQVGRGARALPAGVVRGLNPIALLVHYALRPSASASQPDHTQPSSPPALLRLIPCQV